MNEQKLLDELIRHRKYLHMHPELGHHEFKTQTYIIKHIESLGLKARKYKTSTICDLVIDNDYPLIAVRADIDALAIKEINDCNYRSIHDGIMHACGHDGHTAISLVLMTYITENKYQFKVNVRFIFQCDEENNGGAEELCDNHYLDNVQAIYGLHLDTNLEVGQIGYKYDQMNAGGDEVDIRVRGIQAHGAYPHLGVDSIVCSANIIMSAQTIVSRIVGPLDSTVITIGEIKGEGTPNTICRETFMRGTIRNLNNETRKKVIDQFITQSKAIGDAMNCIVEIEHAPSYPPLINNNQHVDYVIENAKRLGYQVINKQVPSMGLEDFSYYLQLVPGAFYNIGAKLPNDYRNAHSGTFDFDHKGLLVGLMVQIENCRNFKVIHGN